MTAISTPPFLAWTLAKRCELKEWIDDPQDPMQVERHLRGVQAIGQAHCDGRTLNGICCRSQPAETSVTNLSTLVFREEEVAAGLGGLERVRKTCTGCEANLPVATSQHTLAGCFGWLVLDDPQWTTYVDAAVSVVGASPTLPSTTPAWYGLWMTGADISADTAKYVLSVLEAVAHHNPAISTVTSSDFGQFCSALQTRTTSTIRLSVQLLPPGEIRETDWWIPTHCSLCTAPTKTDRRHRCEVCQQSMRPEPRRRRKRRGNRPFTPIEHILNVDQARRWLEAYCQ